MSNPSLDRLDVNNPQNQQEQTLRFEVSIQEFNVILGALQEIPHRIADPILKKIFGQAQNQISPQK